MTLASLPAAIIRDPSYVSALLDGPAPATRRGIAVTEFTGLEVPAETIDAIRYAGYALRDASWEVLDGGPTRTRCGHDLFG